MKPQDPKTALSHNRSFSLQTGVSWCGVKWGRGDSGLWRSVCIIGALSASRGADAELSEPLQDSGQRDYASRQLHGILSCVVHWNSLIIAYRCIVSQHMTLCNSPVCYFRDTSESFCTCCSCCLVIICSLLRKLH